MDKDQIQMKKDLEHLSKPSQWSSWPFCSVKRRSNQVPNKDLGFVCDDEKYPNGVTVYHGYIFKLPEDIRSLEQTKYDSIQAMLDDDWMVD